MKFTKSIINYQKRESAPSNLFLILAVALLSHARLVIAQVVEKELVSYWTFDKADIEGDMAKDVWAKTMEKSSGLKSIQA